MAWADLVAAGVRQTIRGIFASLGSGFGPRGGLPRNIAPAFVQSVYQRVKEIYGSVRGGTAQRLLKEIDDARRSANLARREFREAEIARRTGAAPPARPAPTPGTTYTVTGIIYEEVDGIERSYLATFSGMKSTDDDEIMARIEAMMADVDSVAEGDYRSSRYTRPTGTATFREFLVSSIELERS